MRPQLPTVLASLALVAAVTPPAYAALAKNSVGSAQIKSLAVKTVDLGNRSVSTKKLQPGSVTGAAIKNGSVGPVDLAPGAKILAGSWEFSPNPQDIGDSISMGSLADGTGPLQVSSPSTLIAWGRVFLRGVGTTMLSPNCSLYVDDVPQGRPAYANLKDGISASVAVSASLDVAPGTHMVSMSCEGGGSAGLAQVNVLAVPR